MYLGMAVQAVILHQEAEAGELGYVVSSRSAWAI